MFVPGWGARWRPGLLLLPAEQWQEWGRNYSRVTSPSWPQGEGESGSEQLFTEQLMNVLPRWMQSGLLQREGRGLELGWEKGGDPPAPQGHAATAGVRAQLSQHDYSFSWTSITRKTTAFVLVCSLTKAPILHSQDSWSQGLGTSRERSH